MMRIELIHPLLVHFPLALLLTGVGLWILALLFKRREILIAAWTILGIGVCFAWMAIIGGELAGEVVKPHLCEPLVLHDHSNFAYMAAILFTATLLIDWARALWCQSLLNKLLYILCIFLFLGSTTLLIYVGYLGGTLVYEQGAAVEQLCHGTAS